MLGSYDFVILAAFLVLLLGMGTFVVGVVILVRTVYHDDLKTLAAQTTSLAQKGLAEDVAGLVGNVSSLLDSMNQLVQSRRGVGVLLTVLGMILMAGACTVAFCAYKVSAV